MVTENEPFGRQPMPVKITIEGADPRDVDYWYRQLTRSAEFKGDMTQTEPGEPMKHTFTIHPRAVND